MSRWVVVNVVLALLMSAVLATGVWAAEEAEAPAVEEAPAEGEAPEGEVPAEGEAEAEEAPEMVKGLLCEVKMSRGGSRRMKEGTMKLTSTQMRREGLDGYDTVFIGDAEEQVSYLARLRRTLGPGGVEIMGQYMVDRYSWSDMDKHREAAIDYAIQNARMGMRESPQVAGKQVAALEALRTPATLERTEGTKEIGGHQCVKYDISLPEGQAKGIVWVATDIDTDVNLGALLAHSFEPSRGGLPFLAQLDELEGFPMRINLEFYLPGRRSPRRLNFWIEKVSEAEFEVSEFQIPEDATITESLGGRARRREDLPPDRPPMEGRPPQTRGR